MFSGGSLDADVMYDMSVLNNNDTEVVKKEGLIAKNSQDTQSLIFPAPGEYQVTLSINGLQIPAGQQQDDASQIDRTRNGIAKGSVQAAQ
jgi:hypothetical protein